MNSEFGIRNSEFPIATIEEINAEAQRRRGAERFFLGHRKGCRENSKLKTENSKLRSAAG